LAIFFLAFAVMLIGGLIVIPVIEAAEAANAISDERNKGKWGAIKGNSDGGSVCPIRLLMG
jgi:uncharacterized membrane protein